MKSSSSGSEWIREMWQDCQVAFRTHLEVSCQRVEFTQLWVYPVPVSLPGSTQEGEEGRRCSQERMLMW